MNAIITFQDHGQDFTEWHIEKGKVVDCQPFQSSVWCGARILNGDELKVGGQVFIKTKPPHSDEMFVKYPIESLRLLPDAFGYDLDIEVRTSAAATEAIHRHFCVKTYAAALRKGLLVKCAKRIIKIMPLSEEQWCRAYGDPRNKSKFN